MKKTDEVCAHEYRPIRRKALRAAAAAPDVAREGTLACLLTRIKE
jgi:hypothetical protein